MGADRQGERRQGGRLTPGDPKPEPARRPSFAGAAVATLFFLIAVPALGFWLAVTWASSVLGAMVLLVVWFLLMLAALPRLRNVSLLLFTLAVGALACELALRTDLMNHFVEERDLAQFRRGLVTTLDPLFVPDPLLAFRQLPDRRARATAVKNGHTIYDVTYTTDDRGFRALPADARPVGDTPVLILGDSFAFGAGLPDEETLAWYLRDLSGAKLQPVTLAVKGYGLHQVLRQLEIGEPQKSGHRIFPWAVLSIVDDHVLRVAGRVQWLHDSPRYVVEPDGRLVARGTWEHPSAFLESLIVGSRLFALAWKAVDIDEAREQHLFVAILREIKSRLAADYGAKLVVLYYSGETWRGDLSGRRDMMVPLLCQAGVTVLDVNALLSGAGAGAGAGLRPAPPVDRFYLADDGHPTALLNRTIASALVEDFKRGAVDRARLPCAR